MILWLLLLVVADRTSAFFAGTAHTNAASTGSISMHFWSGPNAEQHRRSRSYVDLHNKLVQKSRATVETGYQKITHAQGGRHEPTVSASASALRIVQERELQLDKVCQRSACVSCRVTLINLFVISNSLTTTLTARRTKQQVHEGCAFIVRTVVDPVAMIGLALIAKDFRNDIVRVALYDFTPIRNPDKLRQKFPIGTLLLIKHPFYKVAGDGKPIIRCDNPKNVIVLQSYDTILQGSPWYTALPAQSLPTSADECKHRGNEQYVAGIYADAVNSYIKGLTMQPNESLKLLLLSNRSIAYFKLGAHTKAVADATAALQLDATHCKSVLRCVKALYALEQYADAMACCDKYQHLFDQKGKKEFKQLRDLVRQALHESTTGQYDWTSVGKQLQQNSGHVRLNCASYVSNSIKVVPVPNKGLGVIAQQPIAAGTLLIAETALAVVWPEEIQDKRHLINFDEMAMQTPTSLALIDQLHEAMQGNEHLRNQVRASCMRNHVRGVLYMQSVCLVCSLVSQYDKCCAYV
jgi:tetratricopeptide (TPR) repeat protein/ferredoxin